MLKFRYKFRYHPFSTCAIFRKTNVSNHLIRTCTCAYRGVRNNSFSENFACELNEWSFMTHVKGYHCNYFREKAPLY